MIGAAIGYRASPFYWLKQIAVADKEFGLKQNKFKARHAARLIPKLSAGDTTGVTRLIRYDLEQLVQTRGDLDARAQGFPGWWEPRLAGRQ